MTFQFDIIGGRTGSVAPGVLTRVNQPHEVVSGLALSSNAPTRWGDAVVRDASTGQFRPVGASDTAIYGLLVKPYPATSLTFLGSSFASEVTGVNANDTLNILRDGYIAVQVQGATAPVQGGVVYVQTTAATGIPVGTFSAVSSASNFALANAEWAVSGVDAQGVGEVRIRVA